MNILHTTKKPSRVLAIFVAAVMVFVLLPITAITAHAAEWDGTTIASSYAGGSGTSADPYQIATAEQLAYMSTQVTVDASQGGVYFVLTDDIDLGSKPWAPIGRTANGFRGNFDGGGHTISNLYFNDATVNEVGLFGCISRGGVIKNLGLVDVDITANMWVGGLVGHEVAISSPVYPEIIIEECFVTGSITANDLVGGIIPNFGYGQMKNCYTNCTVTALVTDAYLGGICVYLGGYSTMENCYAAGEVKGPGSGSGALVGGLAALVQNSSTLSNSAGLNPSVSGNWGVARLIPASQGTASTLSGNRGFVDMSVTINSVDKDPLQNTLNGSDGADVTAAETLDPDFWENEMGWDSSIWIFTAGKLPLLRGFSATQPDTPPAHLDMPKLSDGAISNRTPQAADLNFTSSQAGTYYYLVSDTVPTKADIMAGTSGTAAAGSNTINLTGLTESAGTVYIFVESAKGFSSEVLALTIPAYAATPPTVTTTVLAGGTVGTAYSQTLAATGGTPISWSLDSGSLPGGLTLSSTGVISGTPTAAGTATFTVKATNVAGFGTKQLSITIAPLPQTSTEPAVTVPAKVKVKFNANGGKIGKAKTKTVKLTKGKPLGKLPKVAKRSHYTFKGWYTKKTGGKKVTAKTKVTKSMTLWAHWKAKTKYGKVVKATAVYVRKTPSPHASLGFVVGHLKKGQTFKIRAFINNKGTSNDWYRLTYKGRTAYVYAKYVKVVYK